MKSSINIANMKTSEDIRIIKKAIISHEGIIACEINKDKSVVNIVYDDYFLELDDIIDNLENIGYMVL